MPFTLEQRHKILTLLNLSLLRSHAVQANFADYSGDFYNMNAVLSPTEYQANRPRPLLFEEDEIWARLDKIENKSEFLVQQTLEALDDCDRIEKALKTLRSSPNYALKRADVLEYEQSQRSAGMEMERDEAIGRLRYFLDLPPIPAAGGGGATTARS
jgi:hypothetical protein